MKKFLGVLAAVLILSVVSYFTFVYYATYSEGVRSGQLIKFSHKGVAFKTWEGEITFAWWGDTKYFVIAVKEEESPFKSK